ncbi:hypothetical protein C8J36_101576 [Rhizobium sp. PP-F2F-G48]|uniref:AbrB/MazE/SpoVT family DNA-binding domain-containing protein n=1 Tax=Rhizobium sp. PP-F2F-G48 TaxID=2135651 RepID=UPI001048D904|nr:AbrB/MazE/SpoVT family DNA-binding domain-containing protein [Rhizobium sp. PP-F2F-G48]TCM58669.1 hypothetical protein C8J36_101576 [Rhizobium sp. PP-F2F-G48]
MARVRLTEAGDLHLPLEVRERLGLIPGVELDLTTSDGRMIAVPVQSTAAPEKKTLSMAEFLDRIPSYEGPAIDVTQAVIDEAVLEEAKRRFEKVNRQSHDNDHD